MSKSLDFAQSFFQNKATSVYVFTDKLERQYLPLQFENVSWNIEAIRGKIVRIFLLNVLVRQKLQMESLR